MKADEAKQLREKAFQTIQTKGFSEVLKYHPMPKKPDHKNHAGELVERKGSFPGEVKSTTFCLETSGYAARFDVHDTYMTEAKVETWLGCNDRGRIQQFSRLRESERKQGEVIGQQRMMVRLGIEVTLGWRWNGEKWKRYCTFRKCKIGPATKKVVPWVDTEEDCTVGGLEEAVRAAAKQTFPEVGGLAEAFSEPVQQDDPGIQDMAKNAWQYAKSYVAKSPFGRVDSQCVRHLNAVLKGHPEAESIIERIMEKY